MQGVCVYIYTYRNISCCKIRSLETCSCRCRYVATLYQLCINCIYLYVNVLMLLLYIYIYIHIYMCVCVCVCVYNTYILYGCRNGACKVCVFIYIHIGLFRVVKFDHCKPAPVGVGTLQLCINCVSTASICTSMYSCFYSIYIYAFILYIYSRSRLERATEHAEVQVFA